MNFRTAGNILNLSGTVTKEDVKKAYRTLSLKFHPDHNPTGLEMMKAINSAYEFLMNLDSPIEFNSSNSECTDLTEKLEQAIEFATSLPGLEVTLDGVWVWVRGETKTHKEALKNFGFNYAPKKKEWSFHEGSYRAWRGKTLTREERQAKHGSTSFKQKSYKSVA